MNIFYAINNEWFVENEIKAFAEKGYNIYIPQMSQISIYSNYGAVSNNSISEEIVNLLDKYDYGKEVICREAIDIINKNFDLLIMDYNKYLLQSVLMFCEINVILKPIGYFSEDTLLQTIIDDIGYWGVKMMEKKWDKIRISVFMSKHSRFIDKYYAETPLYLPKCTVAKRKEEKVLAIFNEVKTNDKVNEKFIEFCDIFKDIPHEARGKQLIPIFNSVNILSIEANEKFSDIIENYKVLYFDQIEGEFPSYVFDAFAVGVPVVYLTGGIIDLFTDTKMTGACTSAEEGKKLCKRICKDRKLARKIIQEQYALIEKISERNNVIEEIIVDFYKRKIKNDVKSPRKLGIIIPVEYTRGVVDYSINFAKAIQNGARLCGENMVVVFAYLDHATYTEKKCFKDMAEKNILVRNFKWEIMDANRANILFKTQGFFGINPLPNYLIANDGISSFEDCDCIVYMSDKIPGIVYASHPYAVVLHDYVQRYFPEENQKQLENYYIENSRFAAINFTTSQATKTEAVQYAGIEKSRVQLLPRFFGQNERSCRDPIVDKYEKYFVWPTSSHPHKNHKFALEALAEYYETGGVIECIITGENIQFNKKRKGDIRQDGYAQEIQEIINKSKALKKHIHFLGDLPQPKYINVLQNARFVFHPGSADNGNGAAFDAAMLGVPTISCDYEAMKDMDLTMGLNLIFFEQGDSEALCKLFFQQENQYDRKSLPSSAELQKFTIEDEKLCMDMYKIMHNYLPI